MKIGAIVPTRNFRPVLLARNRVYRQSQTLPIDITDIVDYPQKRFPFDLTDRYRYGLKRLKDKCNLIFFMEDDDFYPPHYIETMVREYEKAGRPAIFGIGETFFYHPEFRYVWYKHHPGEGPAAFQMCIRSDAVDNIDWSLVNPLFIDAGLFRQLDCKTVEFGKPLSLGIKHGRGSCGAGGHNKWFYNDRIKNVGTDINTPEWSMHDDSGNWLKESIGPECSEWYLNFGKSIGMI